VQNLSPIQKLAVVKLSSKRLVKEASVALKMSSKKPEAPLDLAALAELWATQTLVVLEATLIPAVSAEPAEKAQEELEEALELVVSLPTSAQT
jgi:hypothetical protein